MVFDESFRWCQQRVKSKKHGPIPDPFYLFLSGGAGTCKSHVISAIYQMAQRTLQSEGDSPDEVKIVLAAPTGCAAFNVWIQHSSFL